jgi:hypothetical protein
MTIKNQGTNETYGVLAEFVHNKVLEGETHVCRDVHGKLSSGAGTATVWAQSTSLPQALFPFLIRQ